MLISYISHMDLFRYFHPHHNPRLRNVPLRLQELGEMEQASKELRKALKRAEIRTESNPISQIRSEHFSELVEAIDYVVETLEKLSSVHPGDNQKTLEDLLKERESSPGWENWSRLLSQRLNEINQYEEKIALNEKPLKTVSGHSSS